MPRVTGDNNFDLDDGDYVAGIVLIGIIFFFCGLIVLIFILGYVKTVFICVICVNTKKYILFIIKEIYNNFNLDDGDYVARIVLIGIIFFFCGLIVLIFILGYVKTVFICVIYVNTKKYIL